MKRKVELPIVAFVKSARSWNRTLAPARRPLRCARATRCKNRSTRACSRRSPRASRLVRVATRGPDREDGLLAGPLMPEPSRNRRAFRVEIVPSHRSPRRRSTASARPTTLAQRVVARRCTWDIRRSDARARCAANSARSQTPPTRRSGSLRARAGGTAETRTTETTSSRAPMQRSGKSTSLSGFAAHVKALIGLMSSSPRNSIAFKRAGMSACSEPGYSIAPAIERRVDRQIVGVLDPPATQLVRHRSFFDKLSMTRLRMTPAPTRARAQASRPEASSPRRTRCT